MIITRPRWWRGCGSAARGDRAPVRSTSEPRRVVGRKLEVGDPPQPLLDGDAQLHASQVRTHAAVDADAEGQVPVAGPVEDDLVGVLEGLGVAVGRREGQQHPVAGVDRAAADLGALGALGHDAGHGDRGVVAQELLDGEHHHVGILDEAAPVVGVWARCHRLEPIADQVVSMPAMINRPIVPRMWSSVSGSPSISASSR
jgi:hypothetical protein